jgi:N-acetylmuramoyl-L-alanine amidase
MEDEQIMVKIIENFVADDVKPKWLVNGKYVTLPMTPYYIVIHETANTAKGATDEAHARLQKKGNPREASWHLQVDDDSCYQSFRFNEACMHAGDGLHGEGNRRGIAIETCVNSDGDFKKTIENLVDVVQYLQKKFNIPTVRVKQHNAFSGKNCPRYLRSGEKGITWNQFINMVDDKPAPKKEYVAKAQDTNSIVDYLKLNGQDPSFKNRSELAKRYGISGYRGLASQNIALLNKLRGDAKPKASKPKYKAMNETSIVDFLKKNDIDSSYDNRKALAKKYGIKGYRGTASQNVTLLEKIKKG